MKSDIAKLTDNYSTNNQVELILGGKKYFDFLLKLITNAKESIHIQTYIFAEDETGNLIINALKKSVNRGVDVHLLADGYASKDLSNQFINQLKIDGVNFRFFEPFFKNSNFYFGRRLHHKVVVVDEKYALVGGLNIANHYNDLPNKPSWLDFALYVEGEIAQQLCIICWKTWNGFKINSNVLPREKTKIDFSIPAEKQVKIKILRNDWVRRKNEISKFYIKMFQSSEKEITILCSYFFPGKKIRRAMILAIKRGIKIKVVVAGVSDVAVAKHAERWLYDWLLRNGFEIYEYKKNVLHAKIAVCDDNLMTIGSYNINDISAFASIELNLEVKNAVFGKAVRKTLNKIIATDCEQITTEKYNKTNTNFKKIVNWLAFKLVKILFYLFTFYFRQRN